MSACSVAGCDKDTGKGARGLCGMHYQRVRRGGDIGPPSYVRDPNRSPAERIYPNLIEQHGCWVWTGAKTAAGYGAAGIDSRVVYVHRWVYEDLVREIPPELVADHLCMNPACANPQHIDLVTDGINKARGGLAHGERKAS